MSAALEVSGVVKSFAGLLAVDEVTLRVEAGSLTSLIGPNGAGKTTLFNCITGLLEPDRGHIELGGVPLDGLTPDRRARAGLGRTFQRLEVFGGMTVYENLEVAAEVAVPGTVWRDVLRVRDRVEPEVGERVGRTLALLGLEDVAQVQAGDLPTGTLRVVELGRALCTDPSVLLLDEPASGLDTTETERLEAVLRDIVASGVTVFLVEHDIDLVLDVSDYIHVMDFGQLIAAGPPEAIVDNPAVQAAYLGEEVELGATSS